MSNKITGGCLCRKIRYTISQSVQNIIACHCANCQKASGSGMSHNAIIATSAVTFTADTPKVYADTAQSGNTLHRYFCADCGSPIYSQREKSPEMTVNKVGSLDNTHAMKLILNIWTASARPWVHIDPASEQHPENRPAKN